MEFRRSAATVISRAQLQTDAVGVREPEQEYMCVAERVKQTNFNKDLQEIRKLQFVFDSGFVENSSRRIRSYNPVLERWKFEQKIVFETDEIHFRSYEEKQLETALRERLNTATSTIFYQVSMDKAFNERFPNEPFDEVLKRGIAYRESVGSVETKREEAELNGYLEVVDKLTNSETPIGTKIMVISGPGMIEDTLYPHNFVDVYEKIKEPTGEIKIQMKRTTSQTSYEEYRQIVQSLKRDYFKDFSGPADAWFLSHPIQIDQVPKITIHADAMAEETFEKIFEACMPLILNYIDILCDDKFDPKQIKIAFNAILNKADLEKERINKRKIGIFTTPLPIFRNTREEAYYLGTKPVQEISAGCGLSGGFSTDSIANSVAKFASGNSQEGWHMGICRKCKNLTSVGGCNICATCVLLYYSNN